MKIENCKLQIGGLAIVATAVAFVMSSSRAEEKPATTPRPGEKLFVETVGPLLRNRCVQCHGDGDLQEAGLDLTSREATLRGGMSDRKTLVPGDPDKSLLYIVVTRRDPDLQMPPDEEEKLSEAEVAAVGEWIAAGAPWIDTPKSTSKVAATAGAATLNNVDPWSASAGDATLTMPTSGGLSPEWTDRKYAPADVWAYLPVRRPVVPRSLDDSGRQRHPIDAFLQAKLEAKQLPTAGEADPVVWLRRATFNLTGLPPSEEDKETGRQGDREKEYTAVIDKLLASPHYGEQMARQWLDVVRYADTSGFSNDYERPHAWRYRDYVVRSFNADKPFDRFAIEQLAGDELDPNDPEMLIAVGFLRMGPWEHTAMSVAAETRQAFLDDVTNSVGVTFLGQGLRCARCHDHKFDPVPTRDYYRIQACFAPVQFLDRDVAYLEQESTAGLTKTKPASERRLAEARTILAEFDAKRRAAQQQWAKDHGYASIDEVPADKRPPQYDGLTDREKSLRKIYQKREAYYQLEMRRFEAQALSVYDGPTVVFDMQRGKPQMMGGKKAGGGGGAKPQASPKTPATAQTVSILRGGALASPGDRVSPGVLSACFASSDAHQPTAWNTVPHTMQGRRLALARWVASEQNPLTARVIVNRVWQMHFGRGLVATPNNFGKMGARPTHPELLDWLAVWFMEHDWSLKKLHRLIMTSAAYRRSSSPVDAAQVAEFDAKNELLSYYPTRRLAAEELRDSLLAASGELNRAVGGPPVFPEINWETAMQPRHIMGSVAPAYQPSIDPADRHRRTLYAFQCRTLADPMLEVFNKPGSETSCERRDQTTVAPQVFALFNGQATHDRALALAAAVCRETASDEQRLDALFGRLLLRLPTEDERQACSEHFVRMLEHHRTHAPQKVAPPTKVAREMVEELTGETFHWEEELDAMRDFQADLKPWDVSAEVRAWSEVCLVLMNANEFVYLR